MNPTSLSQIAEWCGGRLIQGRPSDRVSVVSTDTRSLGGGELFVALKGDRFDGHKFVEQADAAGVAAMLLSALPLATESYRGGMVHVPDSLVALQQLALRFRRSLSELYVVGITGSNGKTSTKDFLNAVLSAGGEVNATRGNLNNHIGLPLTILETEETHRYGVWEMGMSNPGEIEVLAEIARPDAAVITNVGNAHIEFMKTREAIAQEKGMLVEAIDANGFVVLNANDDMSESLAERCRGRVVMAGIDAGEITAGDLKATERGITFRLHSRGDSAMVELGVPGEHMVTNAVLAAAVGVERGLSLEEISKALGSVALTGGRLERREVGGLSFLDDTYNANPDSVKAALGALSGIEISGRRVAVLGRMAELGDREEADHEAIGRAAASAGVDLVIAVGVVADWIARGAGDSGAEVLTAADQAEAGKLIREWAGAEDLILVKGSRSSEMEKVIQEVEGLAEKS